MLGRRVEVYNNAQKVAEVRTPAMAFALFSVLHGDVRVTCNGRVLFNSATDGKVLDINTYAAIVAPRFNEVRFGTVEEVGA